MQMKFYENIVSKSFYKHLRDPPFILGPCWCYGLIVAMAASLLQKL